MEKQRQTNIAIMIVLIIMCIIEAIFLLPYSLAGTLGFIAIAVVLIVLLKLEYDKIKRAH